MATRKPTKKPAKKMNRSDMMDYYEQRELLETNRGSGASGSKVSKTQKKWQDAKTDNDWEERHGNKPKFGPGYKKGGKVTKPKAKKSSGKKKKK